MRSVLPLRLYTAAFLFAAGALLRFHALDRQSLWNDEVATLDTIHTPFHALIERHATYETHPPLYFLQLRVWEKMTGGSLAALRANSALWGTLSLCVLYALTGPDAWGLCALALLAFAPLHLAYSQELRPYAFGVFLVLVSWWSIQKRVPLLWPVLWIALLYTHYWGAFVCLAQALYALRAARTSTERWIVFGAGAFALIAFSFWLPVLHRQLQAIGNFDFWVEPGSLKALAKTAVLYTGLTFKVASSKFQTPGPRPILMMLGAFQLALAGWGLKSAPRFALYWLASLILPWALSYHTPGIYVWYRYPLFMFPAFLLALAAGIQNLKWPALRGICFGIVLGAQCVGLWRYFNGWEKANAKAVVHFIDAYASAHPVVVRPSYFSFLYNYYDREHLSVYDTHTLDSTAKRAGLRGHILFLIAFNGPPDPIRDAFLAEYHVLGRRVFPGYAHLGITVYVLK